MKNIKDFKTISIVSLLVILLYSCSTTELPVEEYAAYIKKEENGLYKRKAIKGTAIEVEYIPMEYMAYREAKGDTALFRKVRSEMEGMEYYRMKISVKNKTVEGLLSENGVRDPFYYLSYGLEKEIYLEEGENKQTVKLFHFERANGMSPFKTFMIGFEKGNRENKTLVIDGEGLNTGPVKMIFKKEDINNIPKLRIG